MIKAIKKNDIEKLLLEYINTNKYNDNIKEWALNCYYKLLDSSPLSLKVTMKLINERKYNTSIVQHGLTIYKVGSRMLDKYNFHDGVKKWRAKKNKTAFNPSFAFDLKHNHESSDLLDNGILAAMIELNASYSCKLKYDQSLNALTMIDIKIEDRPKCLKIDDFVNKNKYKFKCKL